LGRSLTRMFRLPMDNCLILVPLLNSCSIVPHSVRSAETTAKRKHNCSITSVCKHFPKHFCCLQPNGCIVQIGEYWRCKIKFIKKLNNNYFIIYATFYYNPFILFNLFAALLNPLSADFSKKETATYFSPKR